MVELPAPADTPAQSIARPILVLREDRPVRSLPGIIPVLRKVPIPVSVLSPSANYSTSANTSGGAHLRPVLLHHSPIAATHCDDHSGKLVLHPRHQVLTSVLTEVAGEMNQK